MIQLIGFIVLMPMSVRLTMLGRRRALPRPWLRWAPMLAPIAWLLGSLATVVSMKGQFGSMNQVPPELRQAALSDGIAEALQLTLVGGIVAVVVLLGSAIFFTLCPAAPEPDFDDADVGEVLSTKQ